MVIGASRKNLIILLTVLLGAGVIGCLYSLKLPAYKDEAFYQSQYMSIAIEPSIQDASKQFHALRKSQLTTKYKLQDYSLTIFSIGLTLLFFFVLGGSKTMSIRSKKGIVFLGIFAALITSCASCLSLMLDFNRGEFPWWADSIAIPTFAEELPLFILLMGWAIIHSLFVRGKFECGKRVFQFQVLKANYWLSLISFITLLFLLEAIVRASFMMIFPGCLWIYFYLSLAVGRMKELSGT